MPSSIHHAGATRQTGETWPEIWCHLYGNTSESRHLDTSMINAPDRTAPAASSPPAQRRPIFSRLLFSCANLDLGGWNVPCPPRNMYSTWRTLATTLQFPGKQEGKFWEESLEPARTSYFQGMCSVLLSGNGGSSRARTSYWGCEVAILPWVMWSFYTSGFCISFECCRATFSN